MERPEFRTITATRRKIVPWVGNEYSRVLENKNRLLENYDGASGGKTGFTRRAGRCLVFSAERDGLRLIGAVLNCPTWFETAARLLDYGFENFRTERALAEGDAVGVLPVRGGLLDHVSVRAAGSLSATVRVGSRCETALELPDVLEAPVRRGEAVGFATITCGGTTLARCELVAAASVPRRTLAQGLRRALRHWVLRLQRQTRSDAG